MHRDGKEEFYRQLFKNTKIDKSTKELIDFFREWNRKAQKELNKRHD